MRNLIKKNNFGNTKRQSNAALKNMAISLIEHEHITTTKAKARAVSTFVETIFARYDQTLHSQRIVESKLGTDKMVGKIDDLSKDRFKDIDSGFVGTYRVGFRKGDGAEMFKVMLSGYEPKAKTKLTKVKETKPTEDK